MVGIAVGSSLAAVILGGAIILFFRHKRISHINDHAPQEEKISLPRREETKRNDEIPAEVESKEIQELADESQPIELWAPPAELLDEKMRYDRVPGI